MPLAATRPGGTPSPKSVLNTATPSRSSAASSPCHQRTAAGFVKSTIPIGGRTSPSPHAGRPIWPSGPRRKYPARLASAKRGFRALM